MPGQPNFEIDRTQRHFGPIWLQPGIVPINVASLFFCAMTVIIFVTASGVIAPYLLNEHLGMPTSEQGVFTGNLIVMIESIAILLIIPIGVLADKVGRRPIFIGALTIISLGCLVWPLARSVEPYVAVRIVMGVGFSMGTLSLGTVIADYPQDASRGKMISINGVITGLGVALIGAFLFGQLPNTFKGMGFDPITAGRFTLWIMSAFAAFGAFTTYLGVKDGRPKDEKRDRQSLKEIFHEGFGATRKNPRLGIAGVAYFVSRGDLLVMTTFFTLWIVAVGVDGGMDTDSAQGFASRLFGTSQLALIIFFPVMGYLVDRFDRVTTLAVSLLIAAVGYFALYLVGDPFESPFMILVAIMAGAGEAAVIVSGPALVGQEAPRRVRGSVFGVMGAAGIFGVLIHSWASGQLFNGVSYQTPFLYMAVMNAVVGVAAVIVRIKTGTSADVAARMQAAVVE